MSSFESTMDDSEDTEKPRNPSAANLLPRNEASRATYDRVEVPAAASDTAADAALPVMLEPGVSTLIAADDDVADERLLDEAISHEPILMNNGEGTTLIVEEVEEPVAGPSGVKKQEQIQTWREMIGQQPGNFFFEDIDFSEASGSTYDQPTSCGKRERWRLELHDLHVLFFRYKLFHHRVGS